MHAIERTAFSDPWTLDQLAERVGADQPFLVAEWDGRVVGYVVAQLAADEAEILNLAVAARARRRGVGRALVRAILAHVSARGARTVYLEVRESNAEALVLYRSEGFEPAGRRPRYYRRPAEDAIVLRAVVLADRGDA